MVEVRIETWGYTLPSDYVCKSVEVKEMTAEDYGVWVTEMAEKYAGWWSSIKVLAYNVQRFTVSPYPHIPDVVEYVITATDKGE